MKTRIHRSLIIILALCSSLPTSPAQAGNTGPANATEALLKLGEQNAEPSDSEYVRQFTFSTWDRYQAVVKQGISSRVKSPYNLLFVVAADGRIERVFLPDHPSHQQLGRYIASHMVGVQAAKPPQAHWVVCVGG